MHLDAARVRLGKFGAAARVVFEDDAQLLDDVFVTGEVFFRHFQRFACFQRFEEVGGNFERQFFGGFAGFVFVVLGFDAVAFDARAGRAEVVEFPVGFDAGGEFVVFFAIKHGLVYARFQSGPAAGLRLFQGTLRDALVGLRFGDLRVTHNRRTQYLRQVPAASPE